MNCYLKINWSIRSPLLLLSTLSKPAPPPYGFTTVADNNNLPLPCWSPNSIQLWRTGGEAILQLFKGFYGQTVLQWHWQSSVSLNGGRKERLDEALSRSSWCQQWRRRCTFVQDHTCAMFVNICFLKWKVGWGTWLGGRRSGLVWSGLDGNGLVCPIHPVWGQNCCSATQVLQAPQFNSSLSRTHGGLQSIPLCCEQIEALRGLLGYIFLFRLPWHGTNTKSLFMDDLDYFVIL